MISIFFNNLCSSIKQIRLVFGLFFGLTPKEQSIWLWRGTCYSNLFASIMTIYYTLHVQMADLYILHCVNIFLQMIWWICFLSCSWRQPGFADEVESRQSNLYGKKRLRSSSYNNLTNSSNSNSGSYSPIDGGQTRKSLYEEVTQLTSSSSSSSSTAATSDVLVPLTSSTDDDGTMNKAKYDEALDIMARIKNSTISYKLCHTCRVVRPLRSKHCRMINRCVQKFDHFW
jgi:hypothetical protein